MARSGEERGGREIEEKGERKNRKGRAGGTGDRRSNRREVTVVGRRESEKGRFFPSNLGVMYWRKKHAPSSRRLLHGGKRG